MILFLGFGCKPFVPRAVSESLDLYISYVIARRRGMCAVGLFSSLLLLVPVPLFWAWF